uniref:Reverse transcriptase domain-containing protein n=1 Tax=Sparus aurata TaxID=8175 RepID=A0A671TPP2_SPAAU
MCDLKVISLNVNGINNVIKRRKILLEMEKEKADIVYLQETHLEKQEHEKLKKITKSQVYYSTYNSKQSGVVIIIKPHVSFELEDCYTDKEGKYVLIVGKIEGLEISFLNTYYPPDTGPELMVQLIDLLVTKTKGVVIMAGDLNLVMNSKLDSSSTKVHRAEKNASLLRKACSELGLVDIWRELNPDKKEYTCYSGRHSIYNRLDYFFMYKQNVTLVKTCYINSINMSDHAAISLTISLQISKGKRLWRLNNSLLQEPEFIERIKKELNDTEDIDPIILWEGAKAVLRGYIISYSSTRKKTRRAEEKQLIEDIKTIENRHSKTNSKEDKLQLKQKRTQLEKIRMFEIEKLMTFAKQESYDGGPKSLKILAYKLKKQTKKMHITNLKPEQARKITDKDQIVEEFASYYEKLYRAEASADCEQIRTYLRKLELPKLKQVNNEKLTKPITAEEVHKQIQGLKNGKSPGDDGFTNEFYKAFKDQLSPLLIRAYRYALDTRKWAQTWSSSIVTLIHKEGKDATKCASYRPISLLNTDHNIISSILANRLKDTVIDIINPDQCGFIPGRLLADNIRRTLNIIDYAQRQKEELLLMTLDAEKAFDLVSWPFMFETIKSFGIDDTFCQWLQVLYSKPVSIVKTNGTFSRKFSIQRGTRQGDPLSPLLFAIYIEVLAIAIRQNENIKGMKIGKEIHKLALYADDIIIYLTSPESAIQHLWKEIEEYSTVSGYRISEDKCESLSIGTQMNQVIKECYKIKWDTILDIIKYLGISISTNLNELYTNNYCTLERKIRRDLNKWKLIPDGIYSRVETIKMMILPQLLF